MTEQQTPEARDVKTEGGNYNEQIGKHYIHAQTVHIYETAPNPSVPSTNNGKVTASQKQLAFAIAGSFDEVDHAKLKAIVALLQKISGDATIEIIRVEEGSIRIILNGSDKGLERIKELVESGELTEVLGTSVKYAQFVDGKTSDNIKNTELDDKFRLIQEIIPQVDTAIGENTKYISQKSMTKEQEPKQRDIKTESGNYNERIAGNYVQGNYIQGNKNSTKVVLTLIGLITLVVATVGIVFSHSNNAGFFFSNNNIVNQNNSTEEQRKKIERAESLLSSEILTNISYIDNRLGYVAASLLDKEMKGDLKVIQEKLGTLLNDSSSVSYRRLIAQDQVASLRQAFNGRPLRIEAGGTLIQVLIDGKVNPGKINAFYSDLAEVQDASESLLTNLSEVAASTNTASQAVKYDQRKKLALVIAKLRNRSMIAYLRGLIALESLGVSSSNIQNKLIALKYLEPKDLIGQSEVNALLNERLKEAESLASERKTLLQESQIALDKSLKIQNSDPWNVVVGKAIALRKRGQIAEAVAAFKLYGEMFSKSDPTAEQYSRTAQQFTIQAEQLNLEGGVYLYKILKEGAAVKVGLTVGDIIVGYGSKNITTVDNLTSAIESLSEGNPITITYLRMQKDGQLIQKTTSVPKGEIGAGLIPI